MKHNFDLQQCIILYKYQRSNISITCLLKTSFFIGVFLKKETANWFKGIPIILYSNTYKYYCLYQQKYIESRKDGINRLQFLASVEEKNVEPLNDHKKSFRVCSG